ncbi:MAG: peptidylprolyl isomerase, partial [Alistipes sp.]|nr:peptidylprolyl isomerase [Alistipes sp.]
MKKIATIVALTLLLTACSGGSGGKEVRLEEATDSVAYVMGMNIGLNLIRMDSTLNVDAVCRGIREVAAQRTVMT